MNSFNTPGTYQTGFSDYDITHYSYDSSDSSVLSFSVAEKKDLKSRFDKVYKRVRTMKSCKHLIIIDNYFNNDLLDEIKDTMKLHSLSLEDIVNTHQRCKYESYNNYDLCIISKHNSSSTTQISLIITENLVVIFNPSSVPDNAIESVTNRIVSKIGRICERDIGYTVYSLIDSIVDTYFIKLEEMERVQYNLDEQIEEVTEDEAALSREIFLAKRNVIEFKKLTWPLREMVNSLLRDERSVLLKDDRNKLFFRDLQDHITRISENADSLKDSAYNLVEMHTNITIIKTNEVMKVLTIITTIFTPLMFLTSIYGMNFEWIPEIHFKNGYVWFWIIVGIVTLIQIYFFRKKRWI